MLLTKTYHQFDRKSGKWIRQVKTVEAMPKGIQRGAATYNARKKKGEKSC